MLNWNNWVPIPQGLTHWGRVTHKRVSKLTIIGSDNGLSPGRRLAIIWTNAGILLIGPWGTNFSEILIEFYTFSFKKINLKVSSGKWRPSCFGLNVLNNQFSNREPVAPWDTLIYFLFADANMQSGTKPNLVAKIWLPTLVTICNGLPKLVANISSHMDHLVNTGLAVGSLVKLLPIKVATPANQTQFEWFIARGL